MKSFLPGALKRVAYAEVAAQLGKSVGALKVAVSRLKQEYGRAVRDEIHRTVSTPAEAKEELRHLFEVLGE